MGKIQKKIVKKKDEETEGMILDTPTRFKCFYITFAWQANQTQWVWLPSVIFPVLEISELITFGCWRVRIASELLGRGALLPRGTLRNRCSDLHRFSSTDPFVNRIWVSGCSIWSKSGDALRYLSPGGCAVFVDALATNLPLGF